MKHIYKRKFRSAIICHSASASARRDMMNLMNPSHHFVITPAGTRERRTQDVCREVLGVSTSIETQLQQGRNLSSSFLFSEKVGFKSFKYGPFGALNRINNNFECCLDLAVDKADACCCCLTFADFGMCF